MSGTSASEQTRRAVVIGASIGGLLAARALATRFERVTVIERDRLPQGSRPRKGVPQGEHAHALLAGGCEALEELFPGLSRELIARGAIDGDILADSIWFNEGVYLARKPSNLDGLLVSRPLLEAQLRDRVIALPNVGLLDGVTVRTLAFDPIARRVVGVIADAPDDLASGVDLVVDASGRGSRSAAWLTSIGFDPAPEESTDLALSYTTRLHRRRTGDIGGKLVALCGACAPDWRFGVALAQEEGRWIVTLGGYGEDAAPADDDGFLSFARSLPVPEVASIIEAGAAASGFRTCRFPGSRRRRYERLARFPAGFLVVGDALCSFNPVYGQGITVAALQAQALEACLARGGAALAPSFFTAAARLIDTPWQIAAGADFRHPRLQPAATRNQRFLNWYIARLHRAAEQDAHLSQAFIEVANLKARPAALLRPPTVLRVVAGNLRRAGAAARPRLAAAD